MRRLFSWDVFCTAIAIVALIVMYAAIAQRNQCLEDFNTVTSVIQSIEERMALIFGDSQV